MKTKPAAKKARKPEKPASTAGHAKTAVKPPARAEAKPSKKPAVAGKKPAPAPARPAPPARPGPPAKAAAPAPAARTATAVPPAKPGPTGARVPLPAAPPVPAAKGTSPAGPRTPAAGAAAAAAARSAPPPGQARPGGGKPLRPKKGGRRAYQRRGPDGELLAPGELLLPGGALGPDETQYLLRGAVAAEHPAPEACVEEIVAKRGEDKVNRTEIGRVAEAMRQRFESGIEPLLPTRPPGNRRTFQSVVERAKNRRREIGAFLRGLDIGRTETSHMDSHGEASLQSLMEWAARLENLAEADEPEQADYAQFHRGLDQLENTTEALIVDVELTLRRLRDRVRA